MVFNYNVCLQEGLLRKIPPSKEKAVQSFKKAREWLKEAQNSLGGDAFSSAILASYMVMFHAARSILRRRAGGIEISSGFFRCH